MNDQTTSPRLLVATLCALALACGGGSDSSPTAKLGNWKIVELTGSVTEVNSGGACGGTFTYPADLTSAWNGVKVYYDGEMEYSLAFEGVAGSTFPDGYQTASKATAKGGTIEGHLIREDLGTEDTAAGSYDDSKMTVRWTLSQHVGTGTACQIDTTGSGTFVAEPGY